MILKQSAKCSSELFPCIIEDEVKQISFLKPDVIENNQCERIYKTWNNISN